MTSPRPLNGPELHALKIIAKGADETRSQLKAGRIVLDFGVHIVGDLVINADSEFNQPRAPDAKQVIAALLSQFGPRKRAAIVQQIIDDGLAKSIVDREACVGLAESLIASLTIRELTKRRGAVTGQFSVTPVRVT